MFGALTTFLVTVSQNNTTSIYISPLKKVKKDNLNIKYTGVKGKYSG